MSHQLQAPPPARSSTASPAQAPRAPGDADLERTVAAAAAASHQAWASLTKRYDARVRRAARRYGLAPHDVDDVVQQTWMRLFEQIGTLRTPAAVGAWLETTARHESLMLKRRCRHERPTDQEIEAGAPLEPVDERRLVADELRDAVRASVRRLPSQQRSVLTMLLCDPRPEYGEISRSLGIPHGTIGPTRQRGLARLREDQTLVALCED